MYRYFKRLAGVGSVNYIYFWKSKGLFDERINSIITSIIASLQNSVIMVLKQEQNSVESKIKATYNHGTIVHIYVVYEISKNSNISSYPPLANCWFGDVSLTNHVDIDQYKYSGYGIGFDRKGKFPFGNGIGRNCITFWADMSRSVHANNTKNNILVFGKDFTQGLNNTTIYA